MNIKLADFGLAKRWS